MTEEGHGGIEVTTGMDGVGVPLESRGDWGNEGTGDQRRWEKEMMEFRED